MELGEGLASSYSSGRDEDEFDAVCDHLVVTDGPTGEIVGTYRLQTSAMGVAGGLGLYSSREFALERLPSSLAEQSVELGRACVARAHRNSRALLTLWRGVAGYAMRNNGGFLFGCCSVPGTDPSVAAEAARHFETTGLMHDSVFVEARPSYGARGAATRPCEDFVLPPLFDMYLRYGARVCSGPAFDAEFGTTDFLVLLDVGRLAPRTLELFFDG